MAPADAGDFLLDEDDDDFFVEYNPHPYRGGYDIAATFGAPLPPSAKTCYPISSSSSSSAAAAPKREEEPYGDKEVPRDSVHESSEVFPRAATEGKVRRRRGFWRKCVRVLDFVFCYKDPYAEQRIGVDRYVVPVYANRKQSKDDALAAEVEVTPLALGRVELEPHDGSEELVQSNELSWHSNYRDEANTYSQFMSNSYYMPSFAQPCGLPGVLGKPDCFPNSSYSESHQVEEFQHEALLPNNVEHMSSGHPIQCYHHHCFKQPLHLHVEPPEPVSSQGLGYYEHSQISGEYGGTGSLFIPPFYPRDTEIFEQAPSDGHASFQHNRHNLSYQNVYMNDVPLITQPADDSYSLNGSFWPFGEYCTYDI